MPVACARCGTVNPDGNQFCQTCGTPLTAAAFGPSGPPGAPPGPPPGYMPPGPPPGAAAPGYQSPYYAPSAASAQAPVHRTPWVLIITAVVVLVVVMAGCGTAFAIIGARSGNQ